MPLEPFRLYPLAAGLPGSAFASARSALAQRLSLPGLAPGGESLARQILRGGSWNNNPHNARSANRNRNAPGKRNNNVGFRLASTPQSQSRPLHGAAGSTRGVQRRAMFSAVPRPRLAGNIRDAGGFFRQRPMNKPQGRSATAMEKHYAFLRWLVPTLEQFPRGQKFLLGDRLQTAAVTVLECLIEATYSRRPESVLAKANLELEKLRVLFRLAHDLRLVDGRRYEFAARSLDEVGRLVGGWRRATQAKSMGGDGSA